MNTRAKDTMIGITRLGTIGATRPTSCQPWGMFIVPVPPLASGRFGLKYIVDPSAPHAGYPMVRKAIKAAHQRWLVPVVLRLCRGFEDGTDRMRMRTLVAEN
eukprot:5268437-Pyramimonas_sp.AAC.1